MRPDVVTVVLLLVGVLDAVTAQAQEPMCENNEESCGDGWILFDDDRCAKLIDAKKDFEEAEESCKSLGGSLLDLDDEDDKIKVLCMAALHDESEIETVWIGNGNDDEDEEDEEDGEEEDEVEEDEEDGEEGDEEDEDEEDGEEGDEEEKDKEEDEEDDEEEEEDCFELNTESGKYQEASCSEEKSFVCAREK